MTLAGSSHSKQKNPEVEQETVLPEQPPDDNDDDNIEDNIPEFSERESEKSPVDNISDSSKTDKTVGNNSFITSTLNENDVVMAEEYLQVFLTRMTGKSCSQVYDLIKETGCQLTFHKTGTFLEKDETNTYLYIMIAGRVQILTASGFVIREMRAGEILGDLSSIFNLPVTATIKVYASTVLISIQGSGVQKLFKNTSLNMANWIIGRNFLPTHKAMHVGLVYRRMTLHALRKVPLFNEWPDILLKKLIMSSGKGHVRMFPASSYLIVKGDPMTSLLVIIYGTVEYIIEGNEALKIVKVESNELPLIYTEVGVFVQKKTSPVSIRARDICHVICIKRELIYQMVENTSNTDTLVCEKSRLRHLAFRQMCRQLGEHKSLVHLELVCYDLKKSEMYKHLSLWEISDKVVQGELDELEDKQPVLEPYDLKDVESVLVIIGEVCLQTNEAFLIPELDRDHGDQGIESPEPISGSGAVNKDAPKEPIFFRSGAVLPFTADMRLGKVSLVTRESALVLKLKRQVVARESNSADELKLV